MPETNSANLIFTNGSPDVNLPSETSEMSESMNVGTIEISNVVEQEPALDLSVFSVESSSDEQAGANFPSNASYLPSSQKTSAVPSSSGSSNLKRPANVDAEQSLPKRQKYQADALE